MDLSVSKTFARDEVRAEVIPVYMGLIKQIDDQLGLLFALHGGAAACFDNTMIVFTSDHGDYLGDHWMGEKDLFHEPSVKVPLIVYDPSTQADPARGTVCDELVECDRPGTDLPGGRWAPTAAEQSHRLEGRSLLAVAARQQLPRDGAASPSANTTTRRCRWPRSSASRRAMPPVHDRGQALEAASTRPGFRPMLLRP